MHITQQISKSLAQKTSDVEGLSRIDQFAPTVPTVKNSSLGAQLRAGPTAQVFSAVAQPV
jgi:hypothetical protein